MGCLQDVTEENAELALGVKANKGLIPPAAAPTGKTPCSRFSFAMHNNALGNTGCFKYRVYVAILTVLHCTMAMFVSVCIHDVIDLLLSICDAWQSG